MEAIEQAKSKESQLVKETEQLKAVVSELKIKLEKFAGIEQKLRELRRDIDTKQKLYDDFLKRYEMAKVTGALGRFEENERVKVIDKPFTPSGPVNLPLFIYGIAKSPKKENFLNIFDEIINGKWFANMITLRRITVFIL